MQQSTVEQNSNSYKVVASFENVKVRVPKLGAKWSGGIYNEDLNTISFPFGDKISFNATKAVNHQPGKAEKVFIQVGQPIENNIILNKFFHNLSMDDFGKNISAKVEVKIKTVSGKGEFTSLTITKTVSKPTHELKINSNKGYTVSINGTNQNIDFAPLNGEIK
jgi:hypothetical protein